MIGRGVTALALAGCLVAGAGADGSRADEPHRRERIERLVARGPGGALPLRGLAGAPDPRIRASLARGLRDAAPKQALPLLAGLLHDVDPLVRSAAVQSLLLGLREPGIARLRAALERTPGLRRQLDASVRYWSGIYVRHELQALDQPGGTGYFLGMFERIAPLGGWATDPLLRIFGRSAPNGRMTALQRLAGYALGDLGDRSAIEPLRRMARPASPWSAGSDQREIAAVALYKLGRRAEAEQLIVQYRRYSSSGVFGRQPIVRQQMLWRLAFLQQQIRRFDEAIQTYAQLVREDAKGDQYAPLAHYNMACAFAMLRKKEHALFHLHQSLLKGYEQKKWIHRDRELDLIRNDPRFALMLRDPRAALRFDLVKER